MFKAEIASKQAVYTLGLPTRQFPLWVPKLKHGRSGDEVRAE